MTGWNSRSRAAWRPCRRPKAWWRNGEARSKGQVARSTSSGCGANSRTLWRGTSGGRWGWRMRKRNLSSRNFLDANVVIYYLTGDENRFESCGSLIARLERGEEAAESTDLVFAEIVWVLSAQRPRPSRASIRDALSDI